MAPQDQGQKSRVKGIEAVKASINAAKSVSRTLRSSLGPKGMDKMLQSPDGDITISESAGGEGAGRRPWSRGRTPWRGGRDAGGEGGWDGMGGVMPW